MYTQGSRTLGSIMMPIVLKTADDWIKLILYTFVIPVDLENPLFISWRALVDLKPQWGLVVGDQDPNDKKMFFHFETDEGGFNIKGL